MEALWQCDQDALGISLVHPDTCLGRMQCVGRSPATVGSTC